MKIAIEASGGTKTMARRKNWVKVYLSPEQRRILKRIAESLGIGESEVLRQAFMEYAKSISLITEKVHS
ncbi:MAG: ribbon-helix-helix protein, CopG family [Candidatus Bathyarchaeia archaeon]